MTWRQRQLGFTLLEMMIVVGVLAILAAIAIPAFIRWKRQGYKVEVQTVLGKVALLQEQYRAEFGTYLGCASGQQQWPALTGNDPIKKAVGNNTCWQALGLQGPGAGATGSTVDAQLACSYSIFAGPAASWGTPMALPAADQGAVGGVVPPAPWFVIIGECDLDATADGPGNNSIFYRTSMSASFGERNPGK